MVDKQPMFEPSGLLAEPEWKRKNLPPNTELIKTFGAFVGEAKSIFQKETAPYYISGTETEQEKAEVRGISERFQAQRVAEGRELQMLTPQEIEELSRLQRAAQPTDEERLRRLKEVFKDNPDDYPLPENAFKWVDGLGGLQITLRNTIASRIVGRDSKGQYWYGKFTPDPGKSFAYFEIGVPPTGEGKPFGDFPFDFERQIDYKSEIDIKNNGWLHSLSIKSTGPDGKDYMVVYKTQTRAK